MEWRGKPERIRVDNGPEFLAHTMEQWAVNNQIDLTFIPKGKPYKNGYVERFNRSFREEVLDSYLFESIQQGQILTNALLWIYSNDRPHSSLDYHTPVSFLLKYQWKSLIIDASN